MTIELLKGSVDNHIHCCPHINKRSTNIFEVIKKAEQLEMHAVGLMDNFSNTSCTPDDSNFAFTVDKIFRCQMSTNSPFYTLIQT